MSWSSWGLDGLDDSASERFVVEGGGRLLALGIDAQRPAEYERLSDRWSVSIGELRARAPWPTAGDIVIWRGIDRADPAAGYSWGSPARVLLVREDEPGAGEVCLLEDANAGARGPGDDTEWLEEALPADCAVPSSEEWNILDYWELRPLCPRCGGRSRSILYGLPMGGFNDNDDVIFGGCVVEGEPADHQCFGCGHQF